MRNFLSSASLQPDGTRQGILIAVALFFVIVSSGNVNGQAVTYLHNFSDGSVINDGAQITGGLTLGSDGYFYGTSLEGGAAGKGVVYRMSTSGQITILHSFGDGSTTNDGIRCLSRMVQGSDGNLYGVTQNGGMPIVGNSGSSGTIFKISHQGVYAVLHRFGDGSIPFGDGEQPLGSLIEGPDGNFYGTTQFGGTGTWDQGISSAGTIFKVTPQGVVTILHNFDNQHQGGASPEGALTLGPDGNLYGTTYAGGETDYGAGGVVFQLTPAGGFTIIHTFTGEANPGEGYGPQGGLILGPDGNLYGTTTAAGFKSLGTYFKITPQGILTVLHTFGLNNAIDQQGGLNLILGTDGYLYGGCGGGQALMGAFSG